jgi:UPF0755 protein
MKKIVIVLLAVVLLVGAIAGWILLGPGTSFKESKKALYIPSGGTNKNAILDSVDQNNITSHPAAFRFLADRMNYWQNIRPGKYEIKKGASVLSIIRMLRNGQQTPVNLVITKLRTKYDFARLAGNKFEFDSAAMISFLNNNDSLERFGKNDALAMSVVLPDTYTFFWDTKPGTVYKKLADESEKFWTNDRIEKAKSLQLTPGEAYTLASIVDEESNALAEKGNIASVYLNRVHKGMPLQADPTIRFALNDFTIKRVYGDHLNVVSPYNTYRNKGLPPGPICTPSKKTIDAVLNAPATDYLYFVADSSFNGRHLFSATYNEHLQKAKWYQEAFRRRFSPGK